MEPSPAFWTGKQVCVTGGTGFLGYHLVLQLLELGARVRVLALPPDRSHPLLAQAQVDKQFGNVLDGPAVRQVLADCAVVFHTAGIVTVWGAVARQMHAIHADGTRTVLESASPGALVVHTSSIVTLGPSRMGELRDEESGGKSPDLAFDYMHAKRAAEAAALDAAGRGQRVLVTNPGYLVGPDDHLGSVMGRFCVRFWKGRIPFAPPGGFNLVDVRDAARGHLLAAEHGKPGQRYILGGENYRLRDFFVLLAHVAGMKPRGLPALPSWLFQALAGAAECHAWLTAKEPFPSAQQARLSRHCWFCRSTRAGRELGYEHRTIASSMRDTFAWYQARGRLHVRGLNRWWMRPRAERGNAA
ncbi:MAG TPA: NAD-dependent epimerase/dehydratase family protein [Gemmataceae bacterium]|nr:NAD-dependent epimerase/dehydratase family protein [Gemmataceae bacterium]